MNRFFILFFLIPLLQSHPPSDFPVEIKLVQPVTKENIELEVRVKNESALSIMLLKERTQSFKYFARGSTGNYIIEMEKWTGNGYYPFAPPPGESVPTHSSAEYEFFSKGKVITDRLIISRYSLPNTRPPDFFAGQYRVRVSFNTIQWSSAQVNNSPWLEFIAR